MDPTHFLSAPGLAWEACLEKTGIKSKLITDVNILLIVEKGIRGGICHAIHKYAKANNKYMKNDNKNKRIVIYSVFSENSLYGWEMSQKIPYMVLDG